MDEAKHYVQFRSNNFYENFMHLCQKYQRIFRVKDQKNELVKELSNLKQKETQFSQALQSKYGNVNINLETGEITTAS